MRGLLVPPCLLCRLPHASAFIYGDADAVMSFRIVLDGAVFGTACCLLAWAWLSLAGKTCDARAPQQRAPEADGMCSFLERLELRCMLNLGEIYSPFFNRNHTAF